MKNYKDCWYCDNLIAHPNEVMLLHLAEPRIAVHINSEKYFGIFEFIDFYYKYVTNIELLDEGKEYEQEEIDAVLVKLWHFSIEQEEIDEEVADGY